MVVLDESDEIFLLITPSSMSTNSKVVVCELSLLGVGVVDSLGDVGLFGGVGMFGSIVEVGVS